MIFRKNKITTRSVTRKYEVQHDMKHYIPKANHLIVKARKYSPTMQLV